MENKTKLLYDVRRQYDQNCVWRRWTELFQAGVRISEYFVRKDIKKIAIYGIAQIGTFLYEELIDSPVDVVYCIDKSRGGFKYEVDVMGGDELSANVEMIVVTPISSFSSIYNEIRRKLGDDFVQIVGIDEILAELLVESKYVD